MILEAVLKKLTALILILCLLLGFSSCSKKTPANDNGTNNQSSQGAQPPAPTPDVPSSIVVPPYKDYGRGSTDFDKIVYSRPNIAQIIEKFNTVTAIVEKNEISADEQISAIRSVENDFMTVKTMNSLAEIYNHKDSSDEFWKTEYEYLTTAYPLFTQAVEDMIVACARSTHKKTFESDYFGYSLDDYTDGGIYTDEVVALMSEEARLEAEYSSLSTATVSIVYSSLDGTRWEGTADEVYAMAKEKYANDTEAYNHVCVSIDLVYQQALIKRQTPIYVSLIKVRRQIADELGYDSYSAIAYDVMGYDYTPSDMVKLLGNIGRYVTPVTNELNNTTFLSYFQKNRQPLLGAEDLINQLYKAYSKMDPELLDAYSYMLQHKLYDISKSQTNRYPGAFTTYLDLNNSPYVFVTTSGFVKDYFTLAHEFGHFADGYFNFGDNASLDLSEVSSQALELLTLLKLKSDMPTENFKYIEYMSMYSMLNDILLEQSLIALFEHTVYEFEYDEITEANLNRALENAFYTIYGEEIPTGLTYSSLVIPHTVCYPFYVESYVTSGIVSAEIFFKESYMTGENGAGLAIYKNLIKRENNNISFSDALEEVGLTSPFAEGHIREIANNIYYQIIGKDYYKNCEDIPGAA